MIPKKGTANSLKDFRPISLNNRLSLYFTTILDNKLSAHAVLNKLLDDAQFGFLKNRSTAHASFTLKTVLTKYVD